MVPNMREKKNSVVPRKRHREEASPQSRSSNDDTNIFELIKCQLKEKKSVQTCKEESFVKPSKKRKLMDAADHRQAMRIHFEDEIITDILRRLPVQSLLRFKCLSKFWKTLISEPYFKMKHQIHAMNSKKLLVSQCCIGTHNKFSFYCSPLSSVQLVEDVEKLDGPSNYEPSISKLYCSCNGLVLLSIGTHLLLWNPSIRESIELPHSKRTTKVLTYGLGYDTTSDDYKILKFNYPYMEILALKSGFWSKKFGCRPGFFPIFNIPVDPFAFLHGAFHWVSCYLRKIFVVSFSISDEVYGKIELLEPMVEKFNICNKYGVAILRGMVCFFCAPSLSREITLKLWVMKDYGVKNSWIQLYTIRETGLVIQRPLHMFDDGEVLLIYRYMDYVGFPFRTSKGPFGFWSERKAVQQGIIYTESMISPKLLI